MAKSGRLLIIAAATALGVGTLAAPVAAAAPQVALVNGIPGRTVDICIGNNEVKSRLGYGRVHIRSVAAGTRVIRFRAASPGNCNGNTLAQRTIDLVDDGDYTLVGTARAPLKVVVFDNTPVPTGDANNYIYFRHAADLGPVVFSWEDQSFANPSVLPTAFVKGDNDELVESDSEPMLIGAYRENGVNPLVLWQYLTLEGRRHEIIIVGTNGRNARFATIVRPTNPV